MQFLTATKGRSTLGQCVRFFRKDLRTKIGGGFWTAQRAAIVMYRISTAVPHEGVYIGRRERAGPGSGLLFQAE